MREVEPRPYWCAVYTIKTKKDKKKVMIKGSNFFCTIGLFPLQLWAKRWCSVSAVLCGSVHFYTANQKRGGVSN